MTELVLRDYQQDAIDLLRKSLARHKRTVLALPTGGGKTEIAVAIAKKAQQTTGSKLWFIVDRKTLAIQARARFQKYGIRCGLMQGENTELSFDDEAVVATVQTLNSRFEKNPLIFDPDIIVIDEVHTLHDTHITLLNFREVPTIGLSATPDNPALGLHFTDMVTPTTIGKLIDAGYLVPFRVFAPSEPDLTGVRFQRGDFVESDLEDAMTLLTGDIVSHWKRLGENRQTIAFCVNVQHARQLAQQFNHDGVPAAVVVGSTPDEERDEIYAQLADARLKVVTSVLVLTTGFDMPEVSCAIMARPTASEKLYIQMAGRLTRTFEGKSDGLLLDHAGNTVRHGLPQCYEPPVLGESEKRVNKERKVKEKHAVTCSDCGSVMEPGQMICGNCGIERKCTSEVVTVDGRLVEIDHDDMGEDREQTHAFRKRFYKELLGLCEENGWKKGAAVYKYEERYKSTPWGDGTIRRYGAITSEPPSEETRRWVSNRQRYHWIRKQKCRAAQAQAVASAV
jgi:superfamily II DNA or RNA helicase